MKQRPTEVRANLYQFAEDILNDDQKRQHYDDAKQRWIGDLDPSSHDQVKPHLSRTIDQNPYVYSLPVMAAFSIAEQSLISIRKDPWHQEDNPQAWFVGVQNLATGETHEPKVIRSYVEPASRKLWLQVADQQSYVNWPEGRHPSLHQQPYEQQRFEGRLTDDYRLTEADYHNGLISQQHFEDIVALESMMRVVSGANKLWLPEHGIRLSEHEVNDSYQIAA